ncbi:MAG TPA: glycosyltransferase family 4 protein [Alphaproteobacteria bacterium]|nr:glycosyltransferase family 4 protein [Alphaproteobacteria bacterium]
MNSPRLHLVLFFTWDVSLALWEEKGLLEREIHFYERLVECGIDVTFLTWGNARDLEIARRIKGVRVFPLYMSLPRPRNRVLRALMSLLAPWAARNVLRRADILKTNQMWGGWCALAAKSVFGKPLIVRTGFELYRFSLLQRQGLARRAFLHFLSGLTYRRADRIFLATENDRHFVAQTFGIPPERITVQPNWIDTKIFTPANSPPPEGRILFVGRLTRQKNLEALIESVAGTPWTLTLVGEGELRDSLETLAKRIGASVRFTGALPNDRLPEEYIRHTLFVLPSLYEGNPKALLEAMACGCAVVGTNVPGNADLIEPEKNGLLCAPNATDIRATLSRLMDDPPLREKLGIHARERIERFHALDTLIEKEIACYRSLREF